MQSFFRFLEKEGVRHLLISGQACILYGASQFTEDIDLWVRPTARDFRGLLRALAAAGAVVHKLTPPIEMTLVRRGHGFHFRIPPDTYLDVMGRPPRVGSFPSAWARSRLLSTDWGELRVAAPEDLVRLKRTNRPADYEAVSNLVRLRVSESPGDPRLLLWGLRNSFELGDLLDLDRQASAAGLQRPDRPCLRALPRSRPVASGKRREALRRLALELADVQERGRTYWRPILRELKKLHSSGTLIPEGTPVSSLL